MKFSDAENDNTIRRRNSTFKILVVCWRDGGEVPDDVSSNVFSNNFDTKISPYSVGMEMRCHHAFPCDFSTVIKKL